MNSGVRDPLLPGDVHLFLQELLKLLIDVFRYGLPAVEKTKQDLCLAQSFLKLKTRLYTLSNLVYGTVR